MQILKFFTPSCGQCKVVDKMLQDKGISYTSIDCSEDSAEVTYLCEKYHISHVPQVVLIQDHSLVRTLHNLQEIKQWVTSAQI